MVEVFGYDLLVIVQILIVLAGSYLGGKVARKWLARLFEKTAFPEDVERSVVKVSKFFVYFVGLLIIVIVVGFDITSVMIGLGAFSIAIGFAMSNIIQNFVSGILIQGDKPFEIGDSIRVQSYEGKVLKVHIRTTVLEVENGELVYIPNSVFITKPITNKTRKANTVL